jgi:hypothetical protein
MFNPLKQNNPQVLLMAITTILGSTVLPILTISTDPSIKIKLEISSALLLTKEDLDFLNYLIFSEKKIEDVKKDEKEIWRK